VTFCGMSRSACWLLPMRVSVARKVLFALISAGSDCSFTVTVDRVASAVGAVCAMADRELASSIAPKGEQGGFGRGGA